MLTRLHRGRIAGVIASASAIAAIGAPGLPGSDGPVSFAARAGAKAHAVSRCRPVGPRFHSRPDIRIAGVCVSRPARDVAPGYVMVTTKTGRTLHRGLVIFDDRGQIVWYRERPYNVNDLKVVTYQGQPMLAWHEAGPTPHHGLGSYYFMNSHYRIVGRVDIGPRMYTDMHEIQLTRAGTVLLASHPDYRDRRTHKLTRDFMVREIDPATGAVLFEWRARYRLPLSDSYYPKPRGWKLWEPYHGNSMRETADGNVLISLRNTSALYKLDRRTGATIWTLGGKKDSFDLTSRHRSWQFCNQHDATELPNGHILLFDNGASIHGCPDHHARAEEFALDEQHHKVHLVRQFPSAAASPDGRGYHAWYVGSARRLVNGDTIVSWGQVPHVSEFTPDGRVNFDLTLATWTYRAVRAPWDGQPLDRPAVAASRRHGAVTVWASWNGATRVAAWSVQSGPSAGALTAAGPPRPKAGFETRLAAPRGARFVAVQALDAQGQVLASSTPLAVRRSP